MKNFAFLCYWDLLEKGLKELCLLGDKNNILFVNPKKVSQYLDLTLNRRDIKNYLTQDDPDLPKIDDTIDFEKLSLLTLDLTYFGIKFKWLNR